MKERRRVFSSLSVRNCRLYFIGRSISTTGEWAQRIGQAWLVLELTGSGVLLGVTAALQHLPTLVAGPWGGLLADRIEKRRLLVWTQSIAGMLALLLGILTSTGLVTVWMVFAFALLLGFVEAFDKPAKDSLLVELVPPTELANAVTLNSVVFSAAKTVGPALAGVLIATAGLAASFYVNAGSYVAVVAALLMLRATEMFPSTLAPRAPGQLRDGVRRAWASPGLRAPLLLMAASGMFAYEWHVTLPLLARDAFDGDAGTFGLMFSAMGLGAVVGGLAIASSVRPGSRSLFISALSFAVLMVATASAPSLTIAFVGLFLLGAASIAFRSIASTVLQLRADPDMRGRVMALLGVAMVGSTPIGGPLVGWLAEQFGIRVVFALGGIVTAAAAVPTFLYVRRHRRRAGAMPDDKAPPGLMSDPSTLPDVSAG